MISFDFMMSNDSKGSIIRKASVIQSCKFHSYCVMVEISSTRFFGGRMVAFDRLNFTTTLSRLPVAANGSAVAGFHFPVVNIRQPLSKRFLVFGGTWAVTWQVSWHFMMFLYRFSIYLKQDDKRWCAGIVACAMHPGLDATNCCAWTLRKIQYDDS